MRYLTHGDAWYGELRRAIDHGTRDAAPRGMLTRELEFAEFTVADPLSFDFAEIAGREFRHVIGVLEGLSLVGQVSATETFTDRVRKFGDFTDDGVFWGAYGARVHGQVGDLVRRLQGDQYTRQAVLTIFDGGRDLAAAKRDIPCTVSIQFLRRREKLSMRVNMRSNDLWLGTPYDLQQFSILQASVAQAVGDKVGEYHHSAGSLHLYERDVNKAVMVGVSSVTLPIPFPFPLWSADTLAGIVASAQSLLLAPEKFPAETQFELWAKWLLTAG